MSDNRVQLVVDTLSSIIRSEMASYSSEYYTPRWTGDQMDAELKFRKERVVFLRKLRDDFENTMFGLAEENL